MENGLRGGEGRLRSLPPHNPLRDVGAHPDRSSRHMGALQLGHFGVPRATRPPQYAHRGFAGAGGAAGAWGTGPPRNVLEEDGGARPCRTASASAITRPASFTPFAIFFSLSPNPGLMELAAEVAFAGCALKGTATNLGNENGASVTS